jgi:D-alanyl-D-alanine carboxypeptidase
MYTAAPVASISKLMTYLLTMESLKNGSFKTEDTVTVSSAVAAMSQSGDGIIYLEEGQEVTVQELLEAMLVASSNESSVALAELTSGSEEAFVKRMNERAAELGLNSAKFYTSNGLPVYTNDTIPAKLQNVMSPYELFRLCAYLLKVQPQITGITSKTYVNLPSMKYASANSNPLVFNLPGITGLKTGSTARAGYCLAASMPVTVKGETHTIVLVLLGAETASERGQMSEILLRFAKSYYEQNGF